MVLIDAPLTGSRVLEAFHSDEPFLFLGASFMTVGIVSIGFCILRRRFNALLVWLGLFAGLYGLRMWLQSEMLSLVPHTGVFFGRFRLAISYLIPIPAFEFFRVAGFMGRGAKAIVLG